MKNFRIVLLGFLLIPLLGALYWQDSSPSVSALSLLAVTDTPTPEPTTPPPTDTPTPTSTPTTPEPDPTTPSPGITETPPSGTSVPPVETPSVIPALGNGPRMESILLYGAMLLMLLGVVTVGWVKVWQAYRQQN